MASNTPTWIWTGTGSSNGTPYPSSIVGWNTQNSWLDPGYPGDGLSQYAVPGAGNILYINAGYTLPVVYAFSLPTPTTGAGLNTTSASDDQTIYNSGTISIDAAFFAAYNGLKPGDPGYVQSATWKIGGTTYLSYDATGANGNGPGPGQVLLSDNASNLITYDVGYNPFGLGGGGTGSLHDENNLIDGAGVINLPAAATSATSGNNEPGLFVGQFAAVVANGVNTLTISGSSVYNEGLLLSGAFGGNALLKLTVTPSTATPGGLVIANSVVDQTASQVVAGLTVPVDPNFPVGAPIGIIEANGAGTSVTFTGNSTVIGGTIEALNGGIVHVAGGTTTLDGTHLDGEQTPQLAPITIVGTFNVDPGATLNMKGSIVDNGSINFGAATSSATATTLNASAFTLSGTGSLNLSDSAQNVIKIADTFDNRVLLDGAATIQDDGNAPAPVKTLTNEAGATINANGVNALTISNLQVTNLGTLEATGAGGLVISTNTGLNNQGGVIEAFNGSNVEILTAHAQNPTSIEGGKLSSAGSGVIILGDGSTLDGGTHGALEVTAGTHIQIAQSAGVAANLTGTIVLDSGSQILVNGDAANQSFLNVDGAVLKGAGTVALTDVNSSRNNITLDNATLDNQVDIQGAGAILANYGTTSATITNEGTINANGINSLGIGTGITLTNSGTMEATNTGGLFIHSTVNNQGGTIAAVGGDVTLQSGAYIDGGTLTSTGANIIHLQNNFGFSGLDGATHGAITINGTVQIDAGNTGAGLKGEIDLGSNGLLQMAAGPGSPTQITLTGSTVFKGAGVINLQEPASNFNYGGNAIVDGTDSNGVPLVQTLDNQATIQGAGLISNGQVGGGLTLTNEGTIRASGTEIATTNDQLDIATAVFTNTGTLEAGSGGSPLLVSFGTNFTNLSNNTLTGGTYLVDNGGTMDFAGNAQNATLATITTLAAGVSLGTSSTLATPAGAIEQSLTTIASGGTLSLFAHNATWSNAISDSGNLNLNNDTFSDANGLTINAGGGAGGWGAFNTTVADNGVVVAAGGTLVFDQAVTGSGAVDFTRGANVELASTSSVKTVSFDLTPTSPTIDTLTIDNASGFTSTIANFEAINDRIVLKGLAVSSAQLSGPDPVTGLYTLTAKDAGGTTLATLSLSGNLTGEAATVGTDGSITLGVIAKPPAVTASESVSGLTKQTSDTISVVATAASGATITSVEIFDGTKDLGAATLQSNGTWTFTTTGLGDGSHSFTAVATDSAGNATTSAALAADLVATLSPAVSASESVSGVTNLTSDTITVKAAAEAIGSNTITSVEIFDGAKDLGAASLQSNGTWTFTATGLSAGTHNFTAVATDAAGNSATSAAITPVTVVTQSPAVTTSESVSGLTKQTSDTISVVATAASGATITSVEIFDGTKDLGAATLQSNGTWTFTATGLGDGSHSFTAVATDSAGNATTSAALAADLVATQSPAVSASESVSGVTNLTSDTITVKAAAEAVGSNTITSVEIFDGTKDLGAATLQSNGTWTFTTTGLGDGSHSFTAVATDSAGNATTSAALAADLVATLSPAVSASESVSGVTNLTSDTITVKATAEAIGSNTITSVEIFDGAKDLGAASLQSNGTWTFTAAGLTDGTHTFSAVATDAAGNTGTSASLTPVTVVAQAPSVTISTAAATEVYPTITIAGTGEAGTSVQLYDGTAKLGGVVTVDSTGHWSEQVTLAVGTNSITAQDTDAAGSTGISSAVTFTLENQVVGQANQPLVYGTAASDHITVGPSNIFVSAGAGDDTITLLPGTPNQFHYIDGGPGNNTLDMSKTTGSVTVDLGAGFANGNQIGAVYLHSIQNVTAGSGNDTLIGTRGSNTFIAGSGNDTITGGGGGDTFIFKAGFGKTVITDFHVLSNNANPPVIADTLDIDHNIFANWAALDAAITDTRGGAVITVSPTESITLKGVTKAQLEAAHLNDIHFI